LQDGPGFMAGDLMTSVIIEDKGKFIVLDLVDSQYEAEFANILNTFVVK